MSVPELNIGLIHVPYPGQSVSGDGYVVEAIPGGALIAVIDGLGHGEKAHTATVKAVQTVKEHLTEDAETLIKRTHQALVATRGAVMSVAIVDAVGQRLTWAGVGNVAAVILPAGRKDIQKARRHLMVHGGIVGYRMPSVKVFSEAFAPGDTLLMATDGIRSGFIEDIPLEQSPQQLADHIYQAHNRGTDDSLVLVMRYQMP